MSEAAAVAPNPTPAPAAAPVEAPAAQPAAPLTVAEAKAALREPLAPAAAPQNDPAQPAAPKEDATGRLHGEQGRFVEKPKADDGAPSAENTAEPKEGPEAGGDTANAEPAGGDLPEGFVRLDVPEDHPLRAQGHENVPVPKGMEEAFKRILNDPVRRRELETARTTVTQLENQADRLEAALRTQSEFQSLLFTDRRIMDTYWQIQTDHGDDAAEHWLQGLANTQREKIGQHLQAAQQKREAVRHQRVAEAFLANVPQLEPYFPHWTQPDFQQALSAYASYAKATNAPLSLGEFKRFADPIYVQHPKVAAEVAELRTRREQERTQEIHAQGADRERASLERTRELVDANPLGAMPPAAHTGHEPAPPPAPALSYRDARRQATGRGG